MAHRDFLPHKDAELLTWASNYSEKITATPTAFGLTATQATALSGLLATYSAAQALASDPATRTRGTVQARSAAKTPLVAEIRALARIINAFPTITNQQRVDLGLNPRTGEITPIPAPSESPSLAVVSATGRTLKLKLSRASGRRGKAPHADGATIFSFVGAAPPADIAQWKFEGSTTRTSFDVEFPPTVPAGSQVWLTAFWFNPRMESGPACPPISAYIAGGVTGEAQAA